MMKSYWMKDMLLHIFIVTTFIGIYFGQHGGAVIQVVVPDRDIAGRAALYESFQRTRTQFENREPNIAFQLRLSDSPDTFNCPTPMVTRTRSYKWKYYLEFERCDYFKKPWYWTTFKSTLILSTTEDADAGFGCFSNMLYREHAEITQSDEYFLDDCSNVDKEIQQAVMKKYGIDVVTCASGFDIGPFGCADIDECQEKHGCPEHSFCTNTVGSYTCSCEPGTMNPVTGSNVADRGGEECAPSPEFSDPVDVGYDTFTSTLIIGDDSGIFKFTLLAIAANAANLEVEDKMNSRDITFVDGAMTKPLDNITLNHLQPGTQYRMKLEIPLPFFSPIVTTKCYCEIIEDDDTGMPKNAYAIQTNGFVTFQFIDNSRCEDAYSFSRTTIEPIANGIQNAIVFTPDYYYFSEQVCSSQPYTPGLQAADNLRLSKLNVGQEYYYLIRASARQYFRNSNPVVIPYVIQWQTSIDGKVALSEKSGGLPVEDVLVEYRLLNLNSTVITACADIDLVNGWCRTLTTASGRFLIDLTIDDPMLNNIDEFPVELRFAKNTNTISHSFLCSDGTRDCSAQLLDDDTTTSSGSTIIYLRHLEFNVPVSVIDDTSVSFSGKVTVNGTESPTGRLGCPLIGVKVCLKDHGVRNQVLASRAICVLTNSDGEYDLPAVIGTFVSPYVDYRNHTFIPRDSNQIVLFENGIEMKAAVDYVGYDLQDVTKANITLEVAGGLCDRVLGRSVVRLQMEGCSSWEGLELEQQSFRQDHEVIAQIVELNLESVESILDGSSRQVFVDAFEGDIRTADLRGQENSNAGQSSPPGVESTKEDRKQSLLPDTPEITALKEKQTEDSDNFEALRVRFQYNGTDIIKTTFGNMDTGTCTGNSIGYDTYSYHVVSKLEILVVVLEFFEDFGYQDIPMCTRYDPGTNITIQNYLGVADSMIDQEWVDLLLSSSFSAQVEGLKKCNPSCSRTLLFDSNGEGAYVVEAFVAGQPNPVTPYTKSLIVSMEESGASHKSEVVVTGDFELPGGFSVGLPTHKPLLVLRDPPGGGSYSYYHNIRTTLRLTLESFQSYTGFTALSEFTGGVDADMTGCIGLGAAVCEKIFGFKLKATATIDGGAKFDTASNEDQNTASFATTWSYSTSTDPWKAGTASDVFLVPSINVKFKDITEVLFTKTKCATAEEKLKFALDAPDSKPALTFLTHQVVTTIEIPNLERLRVAAQSNVTLLANSTNPSGCPDILPSNSTEADKLTDECKSALTNRDALASSILNWKSFLERHTNITKMAAQGQLKGTPYNWVSSMQDKTSVGKSVSHYSGLVPNKLAENAISLKTGKKTENSSELKEINLFKFSGGGNEFTFELDRQDIKSHTEKLSGSEPIKNSEGYLNVGAFTEFDVKTTTSSIGVKLEGHITYDVTQVATQTDENTEETVIGFVLSDPDETDIFDVEVYLDPDYNTFVFLTTSGQSRCPNEKGTVPVEVPYLQLISGPTSPVLPTDSLIFQLQMSNLGVSTSPFTLYVKESTSLSISYPESFIDIDSAGSQAITVVVDRGVVDYDYSSVQLYMSSVCEYSVKAAGQVQNISHASFELFNSIDSSKPEDDQRRIRFVQPCPDISWAGQLAKDRSFTVNLASEKNDKFSFPITIRNPNAAYRSYAAMVNDSSDRLESAMLHFRRVGSKSWTDGKYLSSPASTTSQIIDFTNITEDAFGYISIEWDVSNLPDGEYEIEARTTCTSSFGDVPDSYDNSYTERLKGVIDRAAPKLVGLPIPTPDIPLFPGDDVTFQFDEDIDCVKPYNFNVSSQVAASIYRVSFDNVLRNNLLISCQGRSISIEPESLRLAQSVGGNYTIRISGVTDLNGNVQILPVTAFFKFSNWNISSVKTSFGVVNLYRKPNSNRALKEGRIQDDIREQMANLVNISANRITIESSCIHDTCSSSDYQHNRIIISPPLSNTSNEIDSLSAYQLLVESFQLSTSNMSQKLFHSLTKPEVTDNDFMKLTVQSKTSMYDMSKDKLDLDQPVNQLNRIIDELRKSNEENMDIMKQTIEDNMDIMKQTNDNIDMMKQTNEDNMDIMKQTLSEELKQTLSEELKQTLSEELNDLKQMMIWIMFGMSCIIMAMLLTLISRSVIKQS